MIALLGALLLWGTSFPVMKYIVATNHPFTVLFYRFLFSFILLIPFFAVKFRKNLRVIAENKKLFILGIMNFVGMAFQITGLKYTTSTKGAIITQIVIVVVPILAYFFLKERMNAGKITGIILSFAGAVVLSTNLQFEGLMNKGTVMGDLLVLAAVFAWSVFIILTRKFAMRFGAFMLLFPSVAATAFFSVPTALATHTTSSDAVGIWGSLYLAVFCTIIPTLLYNYALTVVDASTASIITPIEVLSAGVLGIIFLGETLTAVELSGGALILISIYIVTLRRNPRNIQKRRKGILNKELL
jgi:drug/metabolite transporter (DMT)-like permease